MDIRHPMDRDDIEEMIRVHGLAWREAYRVLLPEQVREQIPVEPSDAMVAEWSDRVWNDRDRILVAVRDGAVRGYLYLRWGDDTKPFVCEHQAGLKEIYVHPDDWGDGVGTRLLRHGIDLLPDNIEALQLEMLSGNTIGQRFYEARGFERVGESEFEIGDESYPTDIYRRSF
ncbi:MAG: N-acetyltransferase family protein [Halobacteriales archaeon]